MAERKSLLLRIPPELWDDLSRWAGDELRSINGQIEWILTRAVAERRAGTRRPEADGPEPRRSR